MSANPLETNPPQELEPSQIVHPFNKLSAGTPLVEDNIESMDDEALKTMWASFKEGIKKYTDQFDIPTQIQEDESVEEFVIRIFDRLKDLNKSPGRNLSEGPGPAIDLFDGAFNCVFGAQVLCNILEDNNIKVAFGNPHNHAVAIFEGSEGTLLMADASNGKGRLQRVETTHTNASIGDTHLVRSTEVLYGLDHIVYEYIPVLPIHQSMAITISNQQYLRDSRSPKEFTDVPVLLNYLELDPEAEYYFATQHFLPELAKTKTSNWWKDEQDLLEQRRDFINKNWVDSVDKVTKKT